MHEQTGEIREVGKILPSERDQWSEAFHEGETVTFKGVLMKIIKIKKLRKEIHLQFVGPAPVDDGDDGVVDGPDY